MTKSNDSNPDTLRLSGESAVPSQKRSSWIRAILNGEFLIRKWINPQRFLPLAFLVLLLALIATFRHFGFDLEPPEGLRGRYPEEIADGWGLWYWAAKFQLNFNLYLFLINICLSIQILLLAFPKKPRTQVWAASIIMAGYCILWFLFGQSRYGMAIILIIMGIASNSPLWLLLLGIIAVLIHKATAGGLLLVFGWLLLRQKKYGFVIALLFSGVLTYLVLQQAQNILILANYENYSNWEKLPPSITPLKYYYCIGCFLIGWIRKETEARSLLILALLFLPTSYFLVFAGRAFDIFALILLFYLISGRVSKPLTYLLLIPFVVDLIHLVFASGLYL